MRFDTYTVICQLEVPIRSTSKDAAIESIKDLMSRSHSPLSIYATSMIYFIPNDPNFNPNVVDENRGMLDESSINN